MTTVIALVLSALAIGLMFTIGYRLYFRQELLRTLTLESDNIQPGDSLNATLEIRPTLELEIEAIDVIVRITERVTDTADADSYPKKLSEQQTTLITDHIAPALTPSSFQLSAELPENFNAAQQQAWLITEIRLKGGHCEYDSCQILGSKP